MSCSPFDLKDYFLKELPPPQALRVEEHIRNCALCREELDRLRLTEAALFALREEEVPRRIAFVSDPVFEPSKSRRWWSAFWNSAPRLGFASVAMLSAALVVFALTRPAERFAPAGVTAAAPAADVQGLIKAAVDKAVRESEDRQALKTQKLVADFLEREKEDRTQFLRAGDAYQWLDKKNRSLTFMAAGYRNEPAEVRP